MNDNENEVTKFVTLDNLDYYTSKIDGLIDSKIAESGSIRYVAGILNADEIKSGLYFTRGGNIKIKKNASAAANTAVDVGSNVLLVISDYADTQDTYTFATIPNDKPVEYQNKLYLRTNCKLIRRSDSATSGIEIVDNVTGSPVNTVVYLTGAQTIDGVKTFTDLPECGATPATANQLVNKTYADTKYSLPQGGIPSTDLDSSVQASLALADSALQSETYTGTITGITMNGSSMGTSGVVNLGTVITDDSGKEDKSNKVTSLSSSSTDTQYPSAKCVYDHVTSVISGLSLVSFEIVNALPETGESNVIYLVANGSSAQSNIYDEYVYINNAFELLGTTQVDLSNYLAKDNTTSFTPSGDYNPATKKYVDDSIAAIPTATDNDIDGLFS